MLKNLGKVIWAIMYITLEWICRFIYLMLPLGLHVFMLQMRERINPVTTLSAMVSENSTWTMVYDGVVMVNTNVGALRKRFSTIRAFLYRLRPMFITIAVLVIIGLLAVIAWKLK